VDPDDSRSSPGSRGNPLLLNSPGAESRSPERAPEERHGVVNAGGNKTVLIAREESKSGMQSLQLHRLFLNGFKHDRKICNIGFQLNAGSNGKADMAQKQRIASSGNRYSVKIR
jgi:hypothetical protein